MRLCATQRPQKRSAKKTLFPTTDENQHITQEQNRTCFGDLNTRFHTRKEGEEDILGNFVFGRGQEYLEAHDMEGNNRELCINFMRDTNMVNMNSQFEKGLNKKSHLQRNQHQ